ncbi:hypothetical protein V6N13_009568 [Hibiscus sabdariffa]|uniref:Uncharacterized protein n=2 Tax=Hibiscus sabdariffa TaxID=183260 RepID=A0ABR2A8C1_9ROSI
MGHSLLSSFGTNSPQLTESSTVDSPSFLSNLFLSYIRPLPPRLSDPFRLFTSNPHPTSPILPRHHRLLHPPFPSSVSFYFILTPLRIFFLARALMNWRYIPKR